MYASGNVSCYACVCRSHTYAIYSFSFNLTNTIQVIFYCIDIYLDRIIPIFYDITPYLIVYHKTVKEAHI